MKFLIINGPNLNLLGYREIDVYGKKTYKDLIIFLKRFCRNRNFKVTIVQTNYEGKIIDYLHNSIKKNYDGIIINPGAYTHYSYAIRDAIKAINKKVVEVHLSDISNREDFRKISVISDCCIYTVSGKGFDSYTSALEILSKEINK